MFLTFKTMSSEQFYYKRLSFDSPFLYRAHSNDAGWDLSYHGVEPVLIETGKTQWFPTGIAVAIPDGYYGRVAPRSGLAFRYNLDILAGVVDSGYRGEIRIGVVNHGSHDTTINPGDRIAQLVITKISIGEAILSEVLPEATRGDAGFGSTG